MLIQPSNPVFYSNVGVTLVKGFEHHGQRARDTFRTLALDPDKTPWIVMQVIFDLPPLVPVEGTARAVAEQLAVEAGLAKLFVPAAPDPDVRLHEQFTVHAAITKNDETDCDECLLRGSVTEAFRRAWEATRQCLFEAHVWTRRTLRERTGTQQSDCAFVVRVFDQGCDRAIASMVAIRDVPLLVTADTDASSMCLYVEKFGEPTR